MLMKPQDGGRGQMLGCSGNFPSTKFKSNIKNKQCDYPFVVFENSAVAADLFLMFMYILTQNKSF